MRCVLISELPMRRKKSRSARIAQTISPPVIHRSCSAIGQRASRDMRRNTCTPTCTRTRTTQDKEASRCYRDNIVYDEDEPSQYNIDDGRSRGATRRSIALARACPREIFHWPDRGLLSIVARDAVGKLQLVTVRLDGFSCSSRG